MHVIALKLDAGRSTNGNPRRGWIVVDALTGDVVDFVDEGYEGSAPLFKKYPTAIEARGSVETTPGEYRALLRGPKKTSRR